MEVQATVATRRMSWLGSVSAGSLVLALAVPSIASAQAAQIPNTTTPGTPAQVDPSPAQTAVVPQGEASDPAATTAPQAAPDTVPADGQTAEIIVTGFRKSLDAALNVKRQSVSSVDAIVAEDIAKFPD